MIDQKFALIAFIIISLWIGADFFQRWLWKRRVDKQIDELMKEKPGHNQESA